MRGPEIEANKASSIIHYRPKGPEKSGDPILFYWRGQYHVFYMRAGQTAAPWGHIVSGDLVHWKELPDAIKPGKLTEDPDHEGCWTGSVIEHNGTYHIFYTGKNLKDPKGDQKVMHATSIDLIRWTKHPKHTIYADGKIYWSKPVNGPVDDVLNYHHQAFRDPEVFWNEEEGKWWMLLHAAKAEKPQPVFGLYSSDDLTNWTPQQPLHRFANLGVSGDCPHIFQMDNRWYIISADHHYTSADKPSGPYFSEFLPYGCGTFAVPKGLFDGERRIIMGWIHDLKDDQDDGDTQWGGTLTMAREIYAGVDGELYQRPPAEIIDFFDSTVLDLTLEPDLRLVYNTWKYDSGALLGYANGAQPVRCGFDVPASYMLKCRVEIGADTVLTIGMRQQPNDPRSGYKLTIRGKEIELASSYRSHKRICDLNYSDPLEVRVFVLGDIIECFVNDAYGSTMRVCDYTDGQLSLEVAQGDAKIKELTANISSEN